MEDREVDRLISIIDKFEKENLMSSKTSKEFLQKAGIIDQNGKLQEAFKNIYQSLPHK